MGRELAQGVAGIIRLPRRRRGGLRRVGDAFSLPILRDSKTFQLADDSTFDRGQHLLKVGGEVRRLLLDSRLDLFSRGQLSFTGAITGSGIGDLLLGLPTFGIRSQADNPIAMRTNAVSAYLQDEWRLQPGPDPEPRPALRVHLAARGRGRRHVDAELPRRMLTPVGTQGVSRFGASRRPEQLCAAPWRQLAGDADRTILRAATACSTTPGCSR